VDKENEAIDFEEKCMKFGGSVLSFIFEIFFVSYACAIYRVS